MINWFKKYISFFYPIQLESSLSSVSGQLELFLYKNQLQLTAPNAIYSWGLNYHNYATAFKKLKIQNNKIDTCLSLGYGMGSTSYILQQYFPDLECTGIEKDPIIIEWNKKYNTLSNQKIIQEDAFKWLLDQKDQMFDLILLDIFIDTMIPQKAEESSFFEIIKRSLNPNGMVIYNRLSNNDILQERTEEVERTFKKVFQKTESISIKGNKMLVGYAI